MTPASDLVTAALEAQGVRDEERVSGEQAQPLHVEDEGKRPTETKRLCVRKGPAILCDDTRAHVLKAAELVKRAESA